MKRNESGGWILPCHRSIIFNKYGKQRCYYYLYREIYISFSFFSDFIDMDHSIDNIQQLRKVIIYIGKYIYLSLFFFDLIDMDHSIDNIQQLRKVKILFISENIYIFLFFFPTLSTWTTRSIIFVIRKVKVLFNFLLTIYILPLSSIFIISFDDKRGGGYHGGGSHPLEKLKDRSNVRKIR